MNRSSYRDLLSWPRRMKRWQLLCTALLFIGLLATLLPGMKAHAATYPYAVFPADPLPSFTYKEHNIVQPGSPNLRIVPVSGQKFPSALEMTTPAGFALPDDSSASYQITVQAPNAANVAKNDVLHATFWLRQVSSGVGQAETTVSFQRSSGDYAKSIVRHINPGTEWKQYDYTFRASDAFAPGEAEFTLWLGYNPPQTIALADFSVTDLGPDAVVPPDTYEGREANAAWRTSANERIEQNRKGNLNVTVYDQAGKPIPDANVHVQMLKHAFNFGTAVDAQNITEQSKADNQRYREKIVQLFNLGVTENDLKWIFWEDAGWRSNTLPAIQWLRDNGLKVRGTNFVWSTPWNALSNDEASLVSNPAALSNRIDNHIRNEAGTVRGQITDWDVTNELYYGPKWLDKLGGPAAVAHWLDVAHQTDPKANLTLNDFYFFDQNGSPDTNQFRFYTKLLTYLKEHGAPKPRIGVESHFSPDTLAPPEKVVSLFDKIAALGVTPQVTEFDLSTPDQQLQADYTRDYLTAVFSNPHVDTFIIWGFWDGLVWLPNTGLFDKNWNLKPNGKIWQDLIYHQWWTDVKGNTSKSGQYKTRGFLGDYQVDVTVNGVTNRVLTTLGKSGKNLKVTFDPNAKVPITKTLPTPAPAPLPASFTPDRGNQLLANGDFEQGMASWSTFGGSPSSLVQSPVHGGQNALLTSKRTAFWQGPAQAISVKNGDTYQSSVWARLAPGSAPATVAVSAKLQTSTNPDGVYFPLGSATVTADGWTQIKGDAKFSWTGSLSAAYWWVSTGYDSPVADFVVDDATLQGSATPRTVTANSVTSISGRINGSLQQLKASDLVLTNQAEITRGLYVPGAPLLRPLNGAIASLELPATGATQPTDKVITQLGGSSNAFLISRTDPYTLAPVAAVATPTGTRDVLLNKPGQSLGDPATLRNLTLTDNAGEVALPAGTYGNIRLNGATTLTLGTANAQTPGVYNLQSLFVSSGTVIKILGPVIINVDSSPVLDGTIGAATDPLSLTLNVVHNPVVVGLQANVYANLNAPTSVVTVAGKLTGRITSDTFILTARGAVTDPTALK